VLFLSGMVAMIMLRTLHKDIARYNQMDDSVRTPHAMTYKQLYEQLNIICIWLILQISLIVFKF